MKTLIETQFNCRIVQFNEHSDDGVIFSALQHGRWVVAESLALLISALQDTTRKPLYLLPMAA